MRSKEYRISQRQRARQRAIRVLHIQGRYDTWEEDKWPVTERLVSFRATTPAPCSCTMCGNPRKHFKEVTRAEKVAEMKLREEIFSLGETTEPECDDATKPDPSGDSVDS